MHKKYRSSKVGVNPNNLRSVFLLFKIISITIIHCVLCKKIMNYSIQLPWLHNSVSL